MVDPRLFARKEFTGGLVVQVLWGLCVTGASFYTALYLQQTRGYSPVAAGAAFLPVAAAVALGAPLAAFLVRRHGPARTVSAGLILVAAGLAVVAVAGLPVMLAALFVVGFGSALTVPLAAVVVAAAPPGRAGVAAAVLGTAREFSGVLGVGGIGVLVSAGHGLARGFPLGLAAAAVVALIGALAGARTLPGAGAGPEPSAAGLAGGDAERGHQLGPGGV
jgi:MFS family permease